MEFPYLTWKELLEDTEPLRPFWPGRDYTDRLEFILWDARLRDDQIYRPYEVHFRRLHIQKDFTQMYGHYFGPREN